MRNVYFTNLVCYSTRSHLNLKYEKLKLNCLFY